MQSLAGSWLGLYDQSVGAAEKGHPFGWEVAVDGGRKMETAGDIADQLRGCTEGMEVWSAGCGDSTDGDSENGN